VGLQDGVGEGFGRLLRHVVPGRHYAHIEQRGEMPLVSGAGWDERDKAVATGIDDHGGHRDRRLEAQGVAVLAGSVAPDTAVALDPESVVRRQLSILGVHNYEPRHLSAALKFLHDTSGRYPWPDLVAEPRPLDAIADLLVNPPGSLPRYSVTPK
jgi:hypothetical protein